MRILLVLLASANLLVALVCAVAFGAQHAIGMVQLRSAVSDCLPDVKPDLPEWQCLNQELGRVLERQLSLVNPMFVAMAINVLILLMIAWRLGTVRRKPEGQA
jgi:hypothetical protein